MVIVCAWCGKRDGQPACWICGDTSKPLQRAAVQGAMLLVCDDCASAGDAARCSVTHGICRSCEHLNFDVKEDDK